MWTPKRVLLLVTGFALFFTLFLVYTHFLGGIDGLPELPLEFWPGEASDEPAPLPDRGMNLAEQKLLQAFGENEQIRDCPIKLEIRAKGLVLAAQSFEICEDGRVKLSPFFLAMYGKERADTKQVEINTVKSKEAYLRFDRPVTNFMEISSRKITGGDLKGDIHIVNNRRTPQQDDDISLFTEGPISYEESLHHVWTKAYVRILDPQTKPEPMTITAKGADVYLTVEAAGKPKGKAAPGKTKSDSISGVDRLHLREHVDMNLWTDGSSGFMSGNSNVQNAKGEKRPVVASKTKSKDVKPIQAATQQKPTPPPKARVTIQTQGPFNYDMKTDRATFDIAQHPNPSPNHVVLNRINELEGKLEQLVCDHLDLQLQRKNRGDQKGNSDSRSVDLEIKSAHATGSNVTLTSDSENLNAFGNDLVYDAEKKESVIRGEPEMVAAKDGNFIHARELRLWHDVKSANQANAKGPGFIEMLDRASGQRPMVARWKGDLTFGRDGDFDLLVLTEQASFEDKVQAQLLEGDTIKVWLAANDKAGPAAAETQRRLPHRLEATGHVRTNSPELRVRDTERFEVWFHDGAPITPLPKADTTAAPGQLVSNAATKPDVPGTATGPMKLQDTANKSNKRPINLTARSVEAHVRRSGSKNDLEGLKCEGKVRVEQAPATPADKGVDIRGDTLQLTRHAEGNILAVSGDPAQVQLDKILIVGPVVNIDQVTNTAWVKGLGAMRMPSSTSFEGTKLAKPSEMTIHWKKTMNFYGKLADFQGDIQAEQDNGRLLCQALQVYFDRPISLREGEKQGQQPRVDKLVCDKNVRIEDSVHENGKLRLYRRIESKELALDNEEGVVLAPGPGWVRLIQAGDKNDGFPLVQGAKPAAAKQAKEEELKLTRVRFEGRMHGINSSRIIRFYDDVEVVHLPADNPDLAVDIDKLPPGAMYLRSRFLQVHSRQLPNGRSSQEMEARQNVTVRAQEFWGLSDVLKYDEQEEKIILEGLEGRQATLYHFKLPGAQPDVIRARKIIYLRLTNECKVDDVQGFNRN